jgi:hypothetical protein
LDDKQKREFLASMLPQSAITSTGPSSVLGFAEESGGAPMRPLRDRAPTRLGQEA